MKNTFKALAVAAAVMASSAASSAEHGLGYVGAAGGIGQADINCAAGASCDDTDFGFKLYGGLRLDKNLAIEGTYFNFGTGTFGNVAGNDFADITGSSFGLGVAFSHDFTSWLSGTARLGLARNKAEYDLYGVGSDHKTVTQPYFGLAVGFRVSRMFTIDAGFDMTKFEYGGEKVETQLYSVGANLRF